MSDPIAQAAQVGAYLELHHESATFLWFGCVIAFFSVV